MDSQILHIFYHDIYWSRIVLNDKQYSKGIKDYEVNLDKFINEINKRQYLKDLFNDYYVADMSYNGALMAEHFREGFILGARIAPEICGFGKLDKK